MFAYFRGSFRGMSASRPILIAAATAAIVALSPAHADVKAGVDAWQAGNYGAAVTNWRPLAEAGDADAQFNMGQAYKLGRGVPSDLKLAQTWYEKAAQQGHEEAQANLGLILFQNGQREAAMPWIRKAADNGDPRARYVLATSLFNGDFATRDVPRAYALMTRAAAEGLPQASTSLSQIESMMTAADKQQGQALIREYERKDGARLAGTSAAPPRQAPPKPAPPRQVASNIEPSRVVVPRPAPFTDAPRPVQAQPAPRPAAPAPVAKPAAKPVAPAPRPVAPTIASPGGRWRVQLGAYGSQDGARGQWSVLSRRIAALSGLRPSYEPVGTLTRLRVGPLADRASADRLCSAAKAAGQACIPIAP
jgi:cell division septation protein DedD